MKLSNHHIDRSIRDAVKDYSPGIPMPWSQISPLIRKKTKPWYLLFLVPALVIVSVAAYSVFVTSPDVIHSDAASALAEIEKNTINSGSAETANDAAVNGNDPTMHNAVQKDKNPVEARNGVEMLENPSRKRLTKEHRPAFSLRREAPLPAKIVENPGQNGSGLFSNVFFSKRILGMISPGEATVKLQSLNDPRRGSIKSPRTGRFYGAVAFKRESLLSTLIFDHEEDEVHKDYEELVRVQQPSGNGNSYGLQLGYMLTPRFGVELGFSVADYEQNVSMNYNYWQVPLYDSISGKIVGYFELMPPNEKQFNYVTVNRLQVLQVPAKFFYRQPLGLRFYAEASGLIQYNIVNKASGYYFDIHEVEKREIRKEEYKNTFTAGASTGLFWLISPYTTVGIEGSMNRFLNPLQKTAYYSFKPGLRTVQLSFKLNF